MTASSPSSPPAGWRASLGSFEGWASCACVCVCVDNTPMRSLCRFFVASRYFWSIRFFSIVDTVIFVFDAIIFRHDHCQPRIFSSEISGFWTKQVCRNVRMAKEMCVQCCQGVMDPMRKSALPMVMDPMRKSLCEFLMGGANGALRIISRGIRY